MHYFRFNSNENRSGVWKAYYTGEYNSFTKEHGVACFKKGESEPCFTLYIPECSDDEARKLLLEQLNQ